MTKCFNCFWSAMSLKSKMFQESRTLKKFNPNFAKIVDWWNIRKKLSLTNFQVRHFANRVKSSESVLSSLHNWTPYTHCTKDRIRQNDSSFLRARCSWSQNIFVKSRRRSLIQFLEKKLLMKYSKEGDCLETSRIAILRSSVKTSKMGLSSL